MTSSLGGIKLRIEAVWNAPALLSPFIWIAGHGEVARFLVHEDDRISGPDDRLLETSIDPSLASAIGPVGVPEPRIAEVRDPGQAQLPLECQSHETAAVVLRPTPEHFH